MSTPDSSAKSKKTAAKQDRRDRLASALRENLKRRKRQQRSREGEGDQKAGSDREG